MRAVRIGVLGGVVVSILLHVFGATLPAQQFSSPSPTGYALLGYKPSINLNSATPADTSFIVVPTATKYTVRRIVCTNASKNLGASTARIAMYTGAGGTGTTVTGVTDLNTLTGSTKFADLVIAATPQTDSLTASTLYVRLTAADGGAATVDCYVYGEILP